MDVTRAVIEMKEQGMSPRAMRAAIDAKYVSDMRASTLTPYPPE